MIIGPIICTLPEAPINHCSFNQKMMLTSVSLAKFCQLLSLIIHVSFTQSIALTRKQSIIVIEKDYTIKKPLIIIFALILEDAIFGYCPFPRLSLIPNTDLKDGSCSFVVSYGSNKR